MATSSGRVRISIEGDADSLVRSTRSAQTALGRFDSSAKSSATGLKRLDTSVKGSATGLKRYETSTESAGREARTFGGTLKTTARSVLGFDRGVKQSASGLGRYETSVKSADRETKTLGTSLKSAAKLAVGAAAAYVGISEAKAAISTTTDLAKATLALNKNLGLSVQTSSEWAAVAKARGVDTRQLGTAFTALSKQIEAAKAGTETSVKAFKDLGISTEQLARQRVGMTIKDIADGMADLGEGTSRTAIAAKLFGKGYLSVTPILRDGSAALQEQLDLANEYGATFSGKAVKSISDLIAAERELEIAQLGLQVQFTKEVAPALIALLKKFVEFIQVVRKTKDDVKRFVSDVVASLREFWQKAGFLQRVVRGVWDAIKDAFRGGVQAIKGLVKVISGVLTGDFKKAWQGVKDIFSGGVKAVLGIVKGVTAPFRSAAKAIGEGLSGAFSAAWDKIKDIFRGGANVLKNIVNWIISNVINRIPGVEIGTIGGDGGKGASLPAGGSPNAIENRFSGGKITAPTAIVGEEAPSHPEFVLATNPKYRRRNLVLWQQAGHELEVPGFQIGGALTGGAPIVASQAPTADVGKGIAKGAGFFINLLDDAPWNRLPGFLSGTGDWVKDRFVDYIKDKVTAVADVVTGGMTRGLAGSEKVVAVGRWLQRQGYLVGEHPAFGGVTPGVHSATGYHPLGRAIDVNWLPVSQEPGRLDAIYPALQRMNPVELLWRVADHFDHLHAAFRKGGIRGGFGAARKMPIAGGGGGTIRANFRAFARFLRSRDVEGSLGRGISPAIWRTHLRDFASLTGRDFDALERRSWREDWDERWAAVDAADYAKPFKGGGVRGKAGTGLGLGARSTLNINQLATLAAKHGMPASLMAAIAMAESSGQAGAVGDGGASHGLWQIHTPSWPQFSASRLHDPNYNAKAAAHVLAVQGPSAWSVFNSGAYRQFLGGRVISGGGSSGGGPGRHPGGAVAGPPGGRGHGVGAVSGGPAGGRGKGSSAKPPRMGEPFVRDPAAAEQAAAESATREQLAAELAALRASIDQQNALVAAAGSIDNYQAIKAVADLLSGEFGGRMSAMGHSPRFGAAVRS